MLGRDRQFLAGSRHLRTWSARSRPLRLLPTR